MATITKIRRVANPKRRHRFAARMRRAGITRNRHGRFVKQRKSNPLSRERRRHRTTTPVIRRYSNSALKRELKRRGAKSNPRRRTASATRRRYHRAASRKRNPMLIELGMVNPRKRRKSVAKRRYRRAKANPRRRRATAVTRVRRFRRRRAVNSVRRYRRRRHAANPVHRVYRRRRQHNSIVRRRRHHYARRMNPFGTSTKDMITMAGGILVGVAATKYIPSLLPASILPTVGSSPWTGILITGAAAFAAGYLAHRFIPSGSFASGVMAGGVALTLSQVLNAVAPTSISSQLALSGLGDILSGYFVVPQNPVTSRPPVAMLPAATSGGGKGVGAFRGAFGARR